MIFYIMGKSASGKDSLYKRLMDSNLDLSRFAIYTTRPKRDGEVEGLEYYFVDKNYLDKNADRVVEKRVYHTVFGDWYYATIDDGKILNDKDYIAIGTLESYNNIKKYYGEDKIFPIYIEVPYEIRRERAIHREKKQKEPKYDEMERRLKADEIDFSEEKLKEANIVKRYDITSMEECLKEVIKDIKKVKSNND